MSDNPYKSPSEVPPVTGVVSGSREDLKDIAQYQKGIVFCILIYVIAVLTQVLIPAEMRIFLGLGVLVLGIVATVFVFLLALKVYGLTQGIVFGLLTLVPCIGLIMLLILNGKATTVLKQNGIEVGLMGANMSQFS